MFYLPSDGIPKKMTVSNPIDKGMPGGIAAKGCMLHAELRWWRIVTTQRQKVSKQY